VRDFLADLAFAGQAPNTLRAATWPSSSRHHAGGIDKVAAAVLCSCFATIARPAVSTRSRKQAAVVAFLRWAIRQDLLSANPLVRSIGGTPAGRELWVRTPTGATCSFAAGDTSLTNTPS
jgi:integrase/recombinase XerD